jgi:hypothetical protein
MSSSTVLPSPPSNKPDSGSFTLAVPTPADDDAGLIESDDEIEADEIWKLVVAKPDPGASSTQSQYFLGGNQ